MESAMLKASLRSKSVPRVELDQRARDARLRLERIDRMLVPRAAMTDFWLRRALCLFSFGAHGEAWQANRIRRAVEQSAPFPHVQSSRGAPQMCGSVCRA
jgi:hypothetical protein